MPANFFYGLTCVGEEDRKESGVDKNNSSSRNSADFLQPVTLALDQTLSTISFGPSPS